MASEMMRLQHHEFSNRYKFLEPDAVAWLGIPGLEKLPAIQWKRRKQETLRSRDLQKFAAKAKTLEKLFA